MKKLGRLVIVGVLISLGFQLIVLGQGGDEQIFKYQFRPGETTYYRMAIYMDVGLNMNVSGQTVKTDMLIKMRWTMKLTPQNMDRNLTRLTIKTTDLEAAWGISSPQGKIKTTMKGDHVVTIKNGVTIIDTRKGIGVAQAKELTREINPLTKTGQIEIFPTGKHGKFIGDSEFVKFWTEGLESQVGFFGLFFSEKPIAVGDSFHKYSTLKKIRQIMLQEPGLQCKITVTRQPEKNMNGRPVSTFKISSPFSQKNLKGHLQMGAQKVQVDIREFNRNLSGSAIFDNKKGELVNCHQYVDAVAKMKMTSGLTGTLVDMDMKITTEIRKLKK